MARRADIAVAQSVATGNWQGAGTCYLVQTPSGVLYYIYIDTGSDLAFKKSSDGGLTWTAPTIVFAGTVGKLSVWYDRWSNIAADLIHMAYTENTGSDTLYRTIDAASSDALSTQTTIFAGVSQASGGHLSIARGVGGNVYCKTVIDAGVEGGFFRLPNANVPNGAWDAARTIDETLATNDQMILLPDYDAADTQDMLAIFWDASADEVSRKLYDDSANSWSETSISTSMVDNVATNGFPHFAAAMDIANTRHVLVAWNAIDAAGQDLKCWTVDSGAITAKTDVVLNATDDCGLAAVAIDLNTGYWHVFYGGKSDGSETWLTAINIYTKVSTDSGSTWGPETRVTIRSATDTRWIATIPRTYIGAPPVAWFESASLVMQLINVDHAMARALSLIGV